MNNNQQNVVISIFISQEKVQTQKVNKAKAYVSFLMNQATNTATYNIIIAWQINSTHIKKIVIIKIRINGKEKQWEGLHII